MPVMAQFFKTNKLLLKRFSSINMQNTAFSELQIRGRIEDNSKTIFLMFYLQSIANYLYIILIIPKLSITPSYLFCEKNEELLHCTAKAPLICQQKYVYMCYRTYHIYLVIRRGFPFSRMTTNN